MDLARRILGQVMKPKKTIGNRFKAEDFESEDRCLDLLRLYIAMIERAVRDLDSDEWKIKRSAVDWIMSERSSYIFSFVHCCEYIRVDADKFRARLFGRGLLEFN